MPVEYAANVTCDGCGQPIAVEETIKPVILQDEDRNAIYFCTHLCLHPYAERRHGERIAAITRHLEGNVEQITANLADARSRASDDELDADARAAAEGEAAAIAPFLDDAQRALAEWTP